MMTQSKAVNKVLNLLEDVAKYRNGWSALCPAHNDSTPSLSIDTGEDGRVLLCCHAGCECEDIVTALGLTMRDLFPDDVDTHWKPWEGTHVATYPYQSADGDVVFCVERYEMQDPAHPAFGKKEFLQTVPGKKGGPKANGIETVPYRLPEVIKAVEQGETVFIVEGEKDVHTLEEWGLVATTCPMGAGKWKEHYTGHLRDAEVVILPDNDDSGQQHGQTVAAKLHGYVASLRVLELDGVPPKGDITDWVEEGHTADELQALVGQTPEWIPPPGGDGTADLFKADLEVSPAEKPLEHPDAFWYSKAGTPPVGIDRQRLLRYLHREGYRKSYGGEELQSHLVRVTDNVVERTSVERIKDHVVEFVRNLDPCETLMADHNEEIENALIRGATSYFSKSLFQFLDRLDRPFKRDTSETAYFYYRNGFVEVTADGHEFLSYDELDGLIWKDQILERNFTPPEKGNQESSVWTTFLRNVSGNETDRFEALRTATGYLLHGYKDPALTKAIVFMDEVDSDEPNGRTGKSLALKGVSHMVPTERMDARNFSFDSRFAFQSVQLGTRVVDFNDAAPRFAFDHLFSCITDDWSVERKGQTAFVIPFNTAPKVAISTNYVVDGAGSSFEDRIFQVEFSPYYTTEHRPVDDFDERFFVDWDADTWSRFDLAMFGCVQSYLQSGLHEYKLVNVAARRLKQNTCPDFAEWACEQIEPGEYRKDKLLEEFQNTYAPDYNNLTKHQFARWLKRYAAISGLEYKDQRRRVDGDRKRFVTFTHGTN